jgi:hypothetical protein
METVEQAPAQPRRAPLLAVLAGVVAVAVGAGVVATRGGGGADADEALADAAEALEAAGSYRLAVTMEDRVTTGEAGGAGSDTTTRTLIQGEVSGEDWRVVSDAGDWADESVGVGGRMYVRSADDADALAAEPWVEYPAVPPLSDDEIIDQLVWMAAPMDGMGETVDGGGYVEPGDPPTANEPLSPEDAAFAEEMLVPTLGALYLGGYGDPTADAVTMTPGGFAEAFGSFEDAEVVAEDAGGLTLQATRSLPADAAERVGMSLPPGRIELVLDAHRRPTVLRVTVEGERASHRSEVRLSDWGAAIDILVPEGEIDQTPWLDEEAVAEARAELTPLAPTVVPEGWVRVLIDAMPYDSYDDEGEYIGSDACPQLDLVYAPADVAGDIVEDYFDVYLMPADCAQAEDATPFAPGDYGDLPVREASNGLVQALVGDTVVEIDTSLGADMVTAALTSLQPFDLDAELARISAEAEAMWNEDMPVG